MWLLKIVRLLRSLRVVPQPSQYKAKVERTYSRRHLRVWLLSNGMNSSKIQWRSTLFLRELHHKTPVIFDYRDSIKWKKPLTSQTSISKNQAENLLNCKHVLTREKRMTQRAEPNVMKSHLQAKVELRPSQGTPSICPGRFHNCYVPLTPLLPSIFSPFKTEISKKLCSACFTILFWMYVGQKTCLLVHRTTDQEELQ